ncbi:MAG TPA: ABC transporter transmembrane domain-containing protein, partial [Xylella taiwanensis]
RLAGLSLVVIPLVVLPIVLGTRHLQKVARTSQDRIADTNIFAAETLSAVRTVQAYARENYERTRFNRTLETSLRTARQRIYIQTWVTATAIVLVFSAIVGVLWVGAHDVIAGRMSAGTLGQFVLYALIGGGSIGSLAEVWNELQRASGGMGRIFELLKEQSTLTVP